MNSQWIKILHVTDCDTVVCCISDHFIFNLLPSQQRLLNQNLIWQYQCLYRTQRFLIVENSLLTHDSWVVSFALRAVFKWLWKIQYGYHNTVITPTNHTTGVNGKWTNQDSFNTCKLFKAGKITRTKCDCLLLCLSLVENLARDL